ncbi:MAG: hypothetical protein WAQ25_02010 [Candidatus Saccharimonas sp.]
MNEPNQTNTATVKRHMALRALFGVVVILVVSVLFILYGQRVIDRIQAGRFTPTAQLAAVHDTLQLTRVGSDLLYASKPQIDSKQSFNTKCHTEERTTAILGCYTKRTIYLYDINEKSLQGTLEVTAAHEMLHAAYDRLNFFERRYVEDLLQKEHERLKDNAELKNIMAYYAKSEPGAELNELHSLLGTTIPTLSPELEKYYAHYFKDRAKVVALNAAYNQVFGEISRKANQLQKQITDLRPEINSDLARYESDRKQLELDIAAFNERAKSNGFTTQSSFQVARSALLARVDALNKRQVAVNERVAEYNDYIKQLNNLAVRASELNQSINGAAPAAGL